MMTTTITFNGLEFKGRLDSSLPASYLTRRVACQFGCINDVAISVNYEIYLNSMQTLPIILLIFSKSFDIHYIFVFVSTMLIMHIACSWAGYLVIFVQTDCKDLVI